MKFPSFFTEQGRLTLLAGGFVLLLGFVAFWAWLSEKQKAEELFARDAVMAQEQIVNVLSVLQDAETGQRGYLITRDESYLEPYNDAIKRLGTNMSALRDAFAHDDAQAERLRNMQSVVDARANTLQEAVELVRGNKIDEAYAYVRTGLGKALMDEIRGIVAEMRVEQEKIVASRLHTAENTRDLLRWSLLIPFFVIMGLAAYAIKELRQRAREVSFAFEELRRTHEALEDSIQQRESVESQLRQSQKMEAVGQLTGGIAHDFNNMLAVIISALNLLQRKLAKGDMDVSRFIDAALEGAQRAATLTQRLLAFSRQQPLSPKEVDANRMVAGMSDLLRLTLGEQIKIETVLAGGLWKVHADPGQLESAILNLAVNARDAMEGDGKLTIETANSYLDDVYATEHMEVPAGQYVLIAITDTGKGMPPEIVAKAFDPFFTTKSAGKGTGLGLSQVYGFVKQSNGHVKIYSEVNEGTTLKIYLPRYFSPKEQLTQPERRERTSPSLDNSKHLILVVEDDENVRRLAVEALRDLGYNVLHAENAIRALQIIEKTPGITLLFTDVVMPDVNGRKLAEEAVKRLPALKVLYTTGYTRNAVVHNGVLDPGTEFLPKPFSIDDLARKIQDVLSR